jgi:hypothetical protein
MSELFSGSPAGLKRMDVQCTDMEFNISNP